MGNNLKRKFYYSAAIILALFACLLVRFYPDDQGLGKFFMVVTIMLLLLAPTFLLVAIVLVLRFLKTIKPTSFGYIFSASLNIFMGLYGTVLYSVFILTEHKMPAISFGLFYLAVLSLGLWMVYDIGHWVRQAIL